MTKGMSQLLTQVTSICFLFLSHMQVDNVAHWGDILQMAVLELIRKVCRANPAEKGKYIKIILALLQSTSTAVVYEVFEATPSP